MKTASLPHDEPDDLPPDHKSGFVAVVGRPNVGKSTLMNAFLGEKLAIVTPSPQTTRMRQLGILSLPQAQVVFIDTPGVHTARTPLGEYMVREAIDSLPDADVVLLLVDVSREPDQVDERIATMVGRYADTPILLALNKIDLVSGEVAQERLSGYCSLVPRSQPFMISATRRDHVDQLLEAIINMLPQGPRYYPQDQLTETQLRENAAEIIREKILLLFRQEIPHSVAVQVDEFKERRDAMTYVGATIFVEKESQKGILIGHGGQALKRVGEMARAELEEVIGTRVYVALWVKILKNWRRDARALKRLGYSRKA